MAGKFTHRGVEALKPSAARRIVWELPGHGQGNLGVRISPTGLKTWVFMYRHLGKARMMSLGNFPAMSVEDAHAAGALASQKHKDGFDPAVPIVAQRKAERTALTVAELADQYLTLYAKPRKKSADRDEALLKRNVLPVIGREKAAAVKRRDIANLLDLIIARGAHVQANRTHSVLGKMYAWAVERETVELNPVRGYKAPGLESSEGRDRCLSDDEMKAFLGKLDTARMSGVTKLALRFQLLTAARPGEVAGATWSEIDEAKAIWTLPGSRTKNGQKHVLPLSPQALMVLKAAREFDRGAGPVFPSPQFKKGKPLDVSALAHGIRDNLEHFEVDEPFYAHDLRRTAATGMAELGADWILLQKLLNHKLRGETAKYNRHKYDKEMRSMLDKWGAKLVELGLAGITALPDAAAGTPAASAPQAQPPPQP